MVGVRKFFIILNSLIILFFVFAILLRPVAFGQAHLSDAILLTQLGWRSLEGVRAVFDYPHFWSGLTADLVGFSYSFFGASYKALDYAFVLMFALSGTLMGILCWRRMSGLALLLLLALAAALIVSGQPIEMGYPRLTHSYVYNHMALVLMMGLVAFGLRPVTPPLAEILLACVSGIAAYALVMLKVTFGVLAPCVLLACLVQRRWSSAAGLIVGGVVLMLVLDPGGARVVQSLRYLMESPARDRAGGLDGLLRTAFQAVIYQALPLAIASVALGLVLLKGGWKALPFGVSALVLAGGYGAATLTMGGLVDRKLIPWLVVFLIVAVDQLRTAEEEDAWSVTSGVLARAVPGAMAYALILPAVMAAAIGTARAVKYADVPLLESGPITEYFIFGEATRGLAGRDFPDANARRDAAVERMLVLMERGTFDDGSEFVALADGIALLQDIPGIEEKGIIPNGRMFDFTMPLRARVVPEFPVWATLVENGIRSFETMPDSVDLVMISIDLPGLPLLNDPLKSLMGDRFQPCRSSRIWTLYARGPDSPAFCSPPAF